MKKEYLKPEIELLELELRQSILINSDLNDSDEEAIDDEDKII